MWLSKNISHPTNSTKLKTQRLLFTFELSASNPYLVKVNPDPIGNDLSPPYLVEVNGIEPMTSCVQSRRSPN